MADRLWHVPWWQFFRAVTLAKHGGGIFSRSEARFSRHSAGKSRPVGISRRAGVTPYVNVESSTEKTWPAGGTCSNSRFKQDSLILIALVTVELVCPGVRVE